VRDGNRLWAVLEGELPDTAPRPAIPLRRAAGARAGAPATRTSAVQQGKPFMRVAIISTFRHPSRLAAQGAQRGCSRPRQS